MDSEVTTINGDVESVRRHKAFHDMKTVLRARTMVSNSHRKVRRQLDIMKTMVSEKKEAEFP